MDAATLEAVLRVAEHLNAEECDDLIRRIQSLPLPKERPTDTLLVFHVDRFLEGITLRRGDEYGDDER
jgi:hypothetical protein